MTPTMASFPTTLRRLPRTIFAAPTPLERRPPSAVRRPHSVGAAAAAASHPKPKLSWLDLRGAGLSTIERLALEELLLRHDPRERCWAVVGVHEPTESRYLNVDLPPFDDWGAQRKRARQRHDDVYGHNHDGPNRSCAIVLGIGGKPERLVNVEAARDDGVLVLRRFSGGGTVVVDHNSLWTTIIGRNAMLPGVKPFPREIMAWSAESIFGPAFESWNREISSDRSRSDIAGRKRGRQTLVFQGKSCGFSGGAGESLILPSKDTRQQSLEENSPPKFELRENDYVFGERKIGGNAQSIVSGGFMHHTSFLWDYDLSNMAYLTLPEKRPEYRSDRSHDKFLARLKEYHGQRSSKNSLWAHMKKATNDRFELEEVRLDNVMKIAEDKFGGFQEWFDGKCRTKVVRL